MTTDSQVGDRGAQTTCVEMPYKMVRRSYCGISSRLRSGEGKAKRDGDGITGSEITLEPCGYN
eukprot:scaffold8419_cov62-Attheya_sp.AAC.4